MAHKQMQTNGVLWLMLAGAMASLAQEEQASPGAAQFNTRIAATQINVEQGPGLPCEALGSL